MPLCRRASVLVWTLLALCPFAGSAHATQATTTAPETSPSLAERIDALLAAPAVAEAHWGIVVTQMDGTPVYALHADQFFRPASTAKLFTTAAAMSLLGPDATTPTTVSFAAPSQDGTVDGNLTLTGFGDPDLSGHEVPWTRAGEANTTTAVDPLHSLQQFVTEILAHGVRHITGSVAANVLWDPYPQGWAAEDLLWGYGAPVSAASLHDNEVLLTITGGRTPAAPATVTLTPDVDFYHVNSQVTTATSASTAPAITVHHAPGDGTVRVQGSLPPSAVYRTEIAIDDPPLFIAKALRRALAQAGVEVEGDVQATHTEPLDANFLLTARQPLLPFQRSPASADPIDAAAPSTVVLTHSSRTLAEDILPTLKESLNLHAELMLQRLGAAYGLEGTAGGARVVHQWLSQLGIDQHSVVLFDGSGLSTKDLVSPHAEAALLRFAASQPWFAAWKASLPVGGVDGTLRSRFQTASLKGHVLAKTGTLGESRALAGYVQCASGQQLIFTILVDNHEPGSAADRNAMDQIVAAIAAAN